MRLPGFVGPSAVEQSYTASQERTVNLYVHLAQGRPVLYGTPGVEEISSATVQGGRGHFWDASSGREFAVYGTIFFEIAEDGTFTDRGTVALNDNPATISSNGDGGGELFITSGGNGYIFTLATNVLSQVSALDGIADQGDHIDGYFLALHFASSTVYFSNLLDGTTWDTGTDFFQRSASPDAWVAMKVLNGDLIWLFGLKTSEVWFNVGTFPLPFAPHPSGRGLPYGCDAPFSPKIIEGAMTWVGSTANGRGMTLSTTGFEVRRVSTAAVEFAFSGYDQVSMAIGDAYSEAGHVFYECHVPGGVTWCYDLVSQTWHERMTWISEENAERTLRWRHHAYAHGEHRWLDTDTGSLYRARLDLYRDVDDREIRRIRRPPTVGHENQRLFFSAVELLMDVGVGEGQNFVGQMLPASLFADATFKAYWEFEADGKDEFGVSDLTPVNAPTFAPAVYKNGAQLTLVTDRTDSPYFTRDVSSGAFDPGAQSFVVAMKFRIDDDANRSHVLFQLWDGAAVRFHVFRRPGSVGNGLRVGIEDDSAQVTTVDTATAIPDSVAFHALVVSVDPSADLVSVYVDGQLDGSGSFTGTYAGVTGATDAVVGASLEGTPFNTDGRVDQGAYVVGTTWTAAQVATYTDLVAGVAVNPQVMMRYSDDGGRTWSSELWRDAGKIGEFDTRVRWERLGVSRRRVFEFVMTDPVPWRLVDAFVEMGQRPRSLSPAQSQHWS